MRLQFIPPLLHELDTVECEAIACVVWEDVRPMDGLAALCDWRFAGRLSRLLMDGFVTGKLGEVTLVPGRPALAAEKLFLIGGGPSIGFDETRFDGIVETLLRTLGGVSARSVLSQLPGRQANWLAPERAADRLLGALAAPRARNVSWTLVEDLEGQRRIEQHMIEERRRIRPEA
jgi:hypothetical protein